VITNISDHFLTVVFLDAKNTIISRIKAPE